jgi:hypothetical protein
MGGFGRVRSPQHFQLQVGCLQPNPRSPKTLALTPPSATLLVLLLFTGAPHQDTHPPGPTRAHHL